MGKGGVIGAAHGNYMQVAWDALQSSIRGVMAARRIRSEVASGVFRRDSWATTNGGLNEFAETVGMRPKLTRCQQEVGQSSQRVIPPPLMERSMSEEIAKTDADYVRDTLRWIVTRVKTHRGQ